MEKLYWTSVKTPWGSCVIAGNKNGVVRATLPGQTVSVEDMERKETPVLKKAKKQLLEYFQGKRTSFAVPFDLHGTAFQKKVWKSLSSIPYGEVRSYQDIATAVGNKKASRAVGMANNRNPIPIFIPCHCVIGKNGSLVGYGGGLPLKRRLLALEKTH